MQWNWSLFSLYPFIWLCSVSSYRLSFWSRLYHIAHIFFIAVSIILESVLYSGESQHHFRHWPKKTRKCFVDWKAAFGCSPIAQCQWQLLKRCNCRGHAVSQWLIVLWRWFCLCVCVCASLSAESPAPPPVAVSKNGNSKNGKKAEGNSIFSWIFVLALLGAWTAVGVVWFDFVDYDTVVGTSLCMVFSPDPACYNELLWRK